MVAKKKPTSLDDLKPAPYNPRKIKPKAAGGLTESIKKFGDIAGIVWNTKTGNLVCGHQRVDQLRKLGAKLEDGCIITPAGERFSVRSVDWTLAQEKAANVTANNPEIGGSFTEDLNDLLDGVLVDIGKDDFEALNLDALLAGAGGSRHEIVEDVAPEPPKKATTKLGDVWTLGDHRLLCGPCAELKTAAGPKFDGAHILVTDPPYGVSYADKNKFLNAVAPANRIQEPIANDHMKPDEMSKLWVEWFSSVRPLMREGASYYVTGPQVGDLLLLLLLLALRDSGFPLRHMLVWAKNNHVLGRCDYHYKHEPIIYGWVEGSHHKVANRSETS